MLAGRDPDRPCGLVPKRVQCGQFSLDLLEPGPEGLDQALPSRGRRDPARGAGQQSEPEPLFEAADRVAER